MTEKINYSNDAQITENINKQLLSLKSLNKDIDSLNEFLNKKVNIKERNSYFDLMESSNVNDRIDFNWNMAYTLYTSYYCKYFYYCFYFKYY